MKLYTYAVIPLLMLMFGVEQSAAASEKKQPVLDRKIIVRFLDDFPALHRELAAYSPVHVQAFEAIIQDGSAIQNIDAVRSDLEKAQIDPGVRKIIEKHGWGRNFTEVYIAIITAYSIFIAEDLFKVSSDPALTAYISKWKPGLHPDDEEIVRKNRSQLEEMILSINQE